MVSPKVLKSQQKLYSLLRQNRKKALWKKKKLTSTIIKTNKKNKVKEITDKRKFK